MTDRKDDMDKDRADIEAIHRLLDRYQQAHREKDWDAVQISSQWHCKL